MTSNPPAAVAHYLAAMPKAELHLHLEGSIAPDTVRSLAERNRIRLPWPTPAHMRAAWDFGDFDSFKEVLLAGVRCLRRPEDFTLVVNRLGERLAADNIRYAEVYWTPQFYTAHVAPADVLLAALNDGRAAVRNRHGIELRWIPDIVRSFPAAADHIADWAAGAMARAGDVVALGLAGAETAEPAERFVAVFTRARDRGLPANPHAGEGTSAHAVRSAVAALRPDRIGHGVSAADDPDLMRELADRRLPLEVCITSNLRLGLYRSAEEHPLRRLVEAGCMVTLNTDDPALFRTTLTAEYRLAVERCGLTLADIDRIALDAVRASYLPEPEKASLLAGFAADQARLKAELGLDT